MKMIIEKLNNVENFMPALSSACTKAISGDYKVVMKVKIELLECWNKVLVRYLTNVKVVDEK